MSSADWDTLEAGLVQRSRLLDAVLADLYGPRRAITGGVLPPQLLFAHPGYLRAARGIDVPGRHQLFMHGCDVSRAADGNFLVNADWTQAPSGAGYALADRRVVAHAIPDLYERIAPRPTSPFAQALRLSLIEAAPEAAEDPVVVVLSPGSHSETAFDQSYLASLLGFPLVESADLVMRDGKVWMRSLGTLKRVDVVLRRVDAAFVDPLDLRADSRLGVVGLVEAQRRGAVTVVNTLGSGILESPGLMRFLPELAERLLGETPLLASAPMYWGGIDRERSHLLAHLDSLLIRSTVGADPIVGPLLSSAQRDALAARIEATPWQWVGQQPPQFSAAPTDYYSGGLASGSVGMRLFTVSQRGGYAPMIGGLGYVLAQGHRCLHAQNRCGQGCLGSAVDAGRCRASGHPGAGRPAHRHAQRHPRGQFAARAVRPVLDGSLRRAGREHGQAADRHPRALPRIPQPPVPRRQRVRAGAAVGAGGDHGHRHRRRRRPPRDDRRGADHAVVADRRPRPARVAGPVRSSGSAWRRARCATRCPTTPGWCSPRWIARCSTSPRGHRSRWAAPMR